MSLHRVVWHLVGVIVSVVSAQAWGQSWPVKPVRMILSQPAGTSVDISARLIADRLGRDWGQQVVVDNRPGGQNVVGSQAAARASADGYTFFYATTAALVINPLTFKALPYDVERQFVPVGLVAKSPLVLATHVGVEAKSLAELVQLDRQAPGKLAIANEGPRTFGGMVSAMLNHATGMKLLQVPYPGVPAAIQDTVAGRTQAVLVSSAAIQPFVKRGELRGIAVSLGKRVVGLEDLPPIGEAYPGFEYVGWFAVMAPTGTPIDAITKFNRDLNRVLAETEVAQRLRDLGALPEPGPVEALSAFLIDEKARWQKVVATLSMTPE